MLHTRIELRFVFVFCSCGSGLNSGVLSSGLPDCCPFNRHFICNQ